MGEIDFSNYNTIQQQKQQELQDMQNYTHLTDCYMSYLTMYLGDQQQYKCGACSHCQPALFPQIEIAERTYFQVDHFLEQDSLPNINEKRSGKQTIYEAGWSLSYHGTSQIGKLVRLSKYEGGGAFAPMIIERATKTIQEHYPIGQINGIVSVPSTKSGQLVEIFAREVASAINIPYFPVLTKTRATQEQKFLKNWVQKSDNIAKAFAVLTPELVAGKTLLLIDDIYDSGHTLREVAQTLRKAGAQTIYPFTITRTLHSDDQ